METKNASPCPVCGGECNQLDETPVDEMFAELDLILSESETVNEVE